MELCDSTDDCQHRSTDVSRVPDVDGSLIGDGTIIATRLLRNGKLNTGKDSAWARYGKTVTERHDKYSTIQYDYIKPPKRGIVYFHTALSYHKSSAFAIGGRSPSISTLFFPQSIGLRCQ